MPALLTLALPLALLLPAAAACARSIDGSAGPRLGVHVHELAAARALPAAFDAVRLWDSGTAWRSLEPRPGTWDFERLDARVALATNQGQRLLLTLGSTPAWASSRPEEACAYGRGCAAPPARLSDWRAYVDTVSRRYRGRIECYEVWNEVRFQQGEDPADPGGSPMFYSGTLAQLLELSREAARIIRRNDPAACVLSPSFHNASPNWIRNLERYLAEGGDSVVDGISFHFYGRTPEETVGALRAVRRTLAARGLADRPVWNTEFGFDRPRFADGPPPADRAPPDLRPAADTTVTRLAALVARSVILGASENVARHYWYALDNRRMGLFHDEPDAVPKFTQAMSELATALTTLRFERCGPLAGSFWRCMVGPAGAGPVHPVRPRQVVWSAAPGHAPSCVARGRLIAGSESRHDIARPLLPSLDASGPGVLPTAGPAASRAASGADAAGADPFCVGPMPRLILPAPPPPES